MTGAEFICDLGVVLALRVRVANQQADRRAGGFALEHTGKDFNFVFFTPLRDVTRGAGLAAIQINLQIRFT